MGRPEKNDTGFRSMVESMQDSLYLCSHDFKIEYMNPAMVGRVGKSRKDTRCFSVIHGLDKPCGWCKHKKVMDGESVEINITSPMDNKTYRETSLPITHDDGTISKMTVLRDITGYMTVVKEKERAEAQLRHAQKMESIGTLAGGIAHDFNNILSSVIGYTELVLEDVEKGSLIQKNLREVFKAGMRARDLVRQILTFARQTDEKPKPIRVASVAKEALKLLRPTIPSDIDIKIQSTSHSLVMADPTQIHQLFMNLCTNAAHAMEKSGGLLNVKCQDTVLDEAFQKQLPEIQPGKYLKITVSDTGVGIPLKNFDSIFEPYFTTKGIGQGTGLGLSVVHGIVKGCGGTVTVESREGKGTVFTIYLPVTGEGETPEFFPEADLPTGTEKILLVDDELAITTMGSQLLMQLGYRVTTRTSSIEALALFRKKPDFFDLVITDMTMPNMTGDKLAAEMLKIRKDIPVVLCTGYSSRISDEQARNIGIKAFTMKPITKFDLAETVRHVLDD